MKTIITKTNVYKFYELSEEAKDKAISELYDINTEYDWWESTYEDAATIGLKITSFELFRRDITGELIESGIKVANFIKENHGESCGTYKAASKFLQDVDNEMQTNCEPDAEIEEMESDFLKSLLKEYLVILRKNYDYLTSEVAIIETI